MKFDSPLYDRIRVRPSSEPRAEESCPACEWPGCDRLGTHRAPKGRGHEGQYWRYCLDHVRVYNQSYNYFAGLPDDAVAAFQREAVTGHRPTWRMGVNSARAAGDHPAGFAFSDVTWHDPFHFLDGLGGAAAPRPEIPEGRTVRNAERKALYVLGLEIDATAAEIKARFKELVKRHHPDAHGGDRTYEDRLRDVIQAYNYLKSVGLC
jgi:hypothetical protein